MKILYSLCCNYLHNTPFDTIWRLLSQNFGRDASGTAHFFLRYAINSNDNANQFCLYNFFGRMKLNEVNLASFVVPLRIPGCIFESLPIMIVSKM